MTRFLQQFIDLLVRPRTGAMMLVIVADAIGFNDPETQMTACMQMHKAACWLA